MNYINQALNHINYVIDSNSSTYTNREGTRVPRVTEILSRMIHNDGLMYWANSLGLRGLKYSTVLKEAADYGSLVHAVIEKYLKEKLKDEDNISFLSFLAWYNHITSISKIIYVEHRLVCQWFGGTLDALIEINGRKYLIDFKTSNSIRFSYFLQLAAYRFMLRVIEGIEVDGTIVLQLSKDDIGFDEYLLDFSNVEHLAFMNKCEETFLSLVYAFYNISEVEKEFKRFF